MPMAKYTRMTYPISYLTEITEARACQSPLFRYHDVTFLFSSMTRLAFEHEVLYKLRMQH